MIRILFIAFAVIVLWFLLLKLLKDARAANFDWTGLVAMAGFIAMAFFLRHVTGMG